jgi:hypothetical protein
MKILIENGPAAGAGDGFAPDLIQTPNLWSDALQRVAGPDFVHHSLRGPNPSGFRSAAIGGIMGHAKAAAENHLSEMRSAGVRGLLVYCSAYHCSHYTAISGDRWADDLRLSDLEPLFVCEACGRRGVNVRPNFDWDKPGALVSGSSAIFA